MRLFIETGEREIKRRNQDVRTLRSWHIPKGSGGKTVGCRSLIVMGKAGPASLSFGVVVAELVIVDTRWKYLPQKSKGS